MIKVTPLSGWDFGEPPLQLVKGSSRGLRGNDLGTFIKRAGQEFADEVRRMMRDHLKPGDVPAHDIIVGATEHYGPNRNGDGFKEASCREKHGTFVMHGKCFRHHQNKPYEPHNHPYYGIIKLSTFNEPMKRIELLSVYNGTKEAADRNGGVVADEECEKLAAGKDIPTSMACLLNPKYPILTRDRGYVKIIDIRVGDYVWTHEGRWRRVSQLNRRTYSGEVFKFHMNGLPMPLELTADHPMFAKVFTGSRQLEAIRVKARRYFVDPADFELRPAGWHEAKEIGVGDRFFYKPVGRYEGYGAIADPDLAAIIGYYAAEGSITPTVVNFSCNIDDSAPRRIPKLMARMWPEITVDIKPHHNPVKGLSVFVNNADFARFLAKYVGTSCYNKVIPPEIFNADPVNKLAFLGAWLDGDGWLDKKGGHWSSANKGLILQGRDLLATLGVPASIYRIDHRKCATSGYAGSGVEYTLNVSHLDVWQLAGHSAKVAAYPVPAPKKRQRPSCLRLCPDGTYALRIKKVTTRTVADQMTYNFEVEEDSSYSAAGLISHNCTLAFDKCSSCGHEAKNRDEYCTGVNEGGSCKGGGLAHKIATVIDDPENPILHADNPARAGLRFFDKSAVARGADRIAFAMGLIKSADGMVKGGAALAEFLGVQAPNDLAATGEMAELYKLACDLAERENKPVLTGRERLAFALPVSASWPQPECSLGEKLAALASEKIILPIENFLSLVHQSADITKVASAVREHLPGVYTRLVQSGEVCRLLEDNPFVPSASIAPYAVRVWASKQAADYSLDMRYVESRILRGAVRYGGAVPVIRKEAMVKTADAHSSAARELAKRYAVYKLAALRQMSGDAALLANLAVLQNCVDRPLTT